MSFTQEKSMQKIGSLILLNQINELDKVPIWLEEMQKTVNFSDRLAFKFDLVLNEAIPNVMSYGYADEKSHEISVNLYQSESDYCLEILDDGIAFNPLNKPEYQVADSLETATIGGRGIHLIKKMSDKQMYARTNHLNKFCIYFNKENA
jgi:anti-sigma regulatory factor (Ser/Thr protein kinase)